MCLITTVLGSETTEHWTESRKVQLELRPKSRNSGMVCRHLKEALPSCARYSVWDILYSYQSSGKKSKVHWLHVHWECNDPKFVSLFERQSVLACWFTLQIEHNCWDWAQTRNWHSILAFHVGGRNSSPRPSPATFWSLPEQEAGTKARDKYQARDRHILTSISTMKPNACTRSLIFS